MSRFSRLAPPLPLHKQLMKEALQLAQKADSQGDVPIGAVIALPDGSVVGRGYNQREATQNPVAHAEILALEEAAKNLGRWRLDNCLLAVTVEPCPMCAGAILNARIPVVVFGTWEEKMGAAGSQYDLLRDRRLPYRAEIYAGVLDKECSDLLQAFFENHR